MLETVTEVEAEVVDGIEEYINGYLFFDLDKGVSDGWVSDVSCDGKTEATDGIVNVDLTSNFSVEAVKYVEQVGVTGFFID